MRRAFLLPALLLTGAAHAQADPFARLSEAYKSRDAEAAAAVYTPDATVTATFDGAPVERHVGTAAIARSFRALFAKADPDHPIDLNFRVSDRTGVGAKGVYRLRMGASAAIYRTFTVGIGPDGRLTSESTARASLGDFEDAPGPVLVRAEEEDLDRAYYSRMAARYRLPDGCDLVVTRSVVRMFLRNTCTNSWQGLNRVSGREWTGGDRVRSDTVRTRIRFSGDGETAAVTLSQGSSTLTAPRTEAYRTEDITFRSFDGTELRGTVYVPLGASGPRPATVMVHGSGPQDRDGYASIIAVMADELASNGRIVLAFDKRGSGESGGDGDRAGFDVLAQDALAGVRALAQRHDVDPERIGIAGSSQAGWVSAEAVRRNPAIADVLLLGAAGSAITVVEQNLYNTKVQMECTGVAARDIDLALDQQRAFFAFLADPGRAAQLDDLTKAGAARPGLTDWLFPDSASTDRSGGQWFTVLDPAFDPRPVWRAYRGRKLFIFSEHDDATPTALAMARARADGAEVRLLPAAQHLGLVAASPCAGALTDVSAFAPELFAEIARFAKVAR